MAFNPTGNSKAVAVSVENVQFAVATEVIPRKMLVIGEPADGKIPYLTPQPDPELALSPEGVIDAWGDGMLADLIESAFDGSFGSVETWVLPVKLTLGGTPFESGTVYTLSSVLLGDAVFEILGVEHTISVPADTTADEWIVLLDAYLTALSYIPFTYTLSETVVANDTINITSIDSGVPVTPLFEMTTEPTGFSSVETVTDVGTPATTVDMAAVLATLGTEDDQNEKYFTDVVHGYEDDQDILDAISDYNGTGDTKSGNYESLVTRPFRVVTGNNDPNQAGLDALIVDGNLRSLDRTNIMIPVPGSPTSAIKIAASACGVLARIANIRPEEPYGAQQIPGVEPGSKEERWTKSYAARTAAVDAGVSTTKVANNAVYLNDVVTYYHPASVSVDSNAYRMANNISKIQNITNSIRNNFEGPRWNGITIVEDKTKVTRQISAQKVRDRGDVFLDCVELVRGAYRFAWIYTDTFSIDKLKDPAYIQLKPGANGFTIIIPVILSGSGEIFDIVVQLDTNITILG